MKDFNFVILYVQDATASADFYARLLGGPPVEASPGFAMFVTPSGVKLGLWTRDTVAPKVAAETAAASLRFLSRTTRPSIRPTSTGASAA